MKYVCCLVLIYGLIGCAAFQPKTFSSKALEEKLVTVDKDSVSFKEILQKNKGKDVFIQIFATYCPVSQDSFKEVVTFQKENPEKTYVFLSVDHSFYDWKRGLKTIAPQGQFYYIPKKGNGALGAFLKLKSIPRFLHVNSDGIIRVFKSSKVSDKLK